ncbi:Domain of unknown function DUF4183 [uncultured Caudovirales phage]|uniref:DUF4183 domain-containing protein n=1 Tax=uncultured Caudovirales phage TaxID=2100421 RepID=A0A6J7X217_9CAUD|nr:Domain of unknown function DUF4183 [uncultured Caudovirales phage]
MPAVSLSPVGGVAAQFFDNNGNVLSGGKLLTYAAGTTTPQATYTTFAGNVPRTNPIVLNAAGRVGEGGEIWVISGLSYKFVLTTSTDVLIATYDNLSGVAAGSATVENFTGTGAQVSFTLARAPGDENATNIYINGVYQQKNTYSVTGTTVLFSEAPPFNSSIEVLYF